MDNFDLKKYLAEGRLLKENIRVYFDEYGGSIEDEPEAVKQVIKHVQDYNPEYTEEDIRSKFEGLDDHFRREAGSEMKSTGQEEKEITPEEYGQYVIDDLSVEDEDIDITDKWIRDQGGIVHENKLLK